MKIAKELRFLYAISLVILVVAIAIVACDDEEIVSIPAISSILPDKGAVGDTIRIEGHNLSEVTQVRFNGVPSTLISQSADAIESIVPTGASTGPITLKAPGARINSAIDFQVLPPRPLILSVQPNNGTPGDTVIISGEYLAEVIEVSFNGTVAVIESKSAGQLIIIVPENATTGKIEVKTEHANIITATDFEILIPDPIILSIIPNQAEAGDTVRIIGEHLSGATEVTFNGKVAVIHSKSSTEIVAIVPMGATTGNVAITTQQGSIITEIEFIVIPAAPVILRWNLVKV